MKRTLHSILGMVVVLALGSAVWVLVARTEPPPAAPPRDLGPVPVQEQRVEAREIARTVEGYGNLSARRRVTLRSELSGRIVEVWPGWEAGAWVEAGTLLVRLDELPLRLAVEAARARLEEAGAGVASAEIEMRRVESTLDKAREQRVLAERESARQAELVAEGASSTSVAERARSAEIEAEIFEEDSRVAAQAAQASLDAARARVRLAQAELGQAEDRHARARLTAPFTGRLLGRAPALGELVEPTQAFGELLDLTRPLVSLRIPEPDLLHVRAGQLVELELPSRPETVELLRLEGRVLSIDAQSDPQTRRGTVDVEIVSAGAAPGLDGGPLGALPAGHFARGRIHLGLLSGAIWIDRRQVAWRDGRACAFVLVERPGSEAELVAERRELVLDHESGEGFVLAAGLAPGDRLIVSSLDRISDGVPCAPVEASGPAATEALVE